MAGLLSTLDDLRSDRTAGVVEWAEAAEDFLDASLEEKIRAVLAFHDPNGLHPSEAETAAIMYAIKANWGES